jgi:hypothetical protein
MKQNIKKFESLNELIKVKINGHDWYVDWYNQKIYTNEDKKNETDFKFLTSSEIEQIRTQIFYQKPMISF